MYKAERQDVYFATLIKQILNVTAKYLLFLKRI